MTRHKFWRLSRLEKERERTLKVCLPHVIKDTNDVKNLFVGDVHVKLPRQSSRSCHVVFPDVESKIKNYKLAKDKKVNGKQVIVQVLRPIQLKEKPKKVKRKKIYMPEIKPEIKPEKKPNIKVTQSLFVNNIPNNTKSSELRSVFPGCVSVAMLKSYNENFKSAIIKLNSIELAEEYLMRERKWPVLNGQALCLKSDTRIKHKKKTPSSLKIYDENGTEIPKSSKSLNCTQVKNASD